MKLETLGRNLLKVKGEVDLNCQMLDSNFNVTALVVDAEEMDNEMILGVDFLKGNNISISLKNRSVTLNTNDSIVSINLSETGKVNTRKYLKMPVFAEETISLKKDKISKIPIKFMVNFLTEQQNTDDLDTYFYESLEDVDGLDGIMIYEP